MEKEYFIAMRVGSLVPGPYLYICLWKGKSLEKVGTESRTWWESGLELPFLHVSPYYFMCRSGYKWLIISLKPGLTSEPAWHKMRYRCSIFFPFCSGDRWHGCATWAYPANSWNWMGLSLASTWQVLSVELGTIVSYWLNRLEHVTRKAFDLPYTDLVQKNLKNILKMVKIFFVA